MKALITICLVFITNYGIHALGNNDPEVVEYNSSFNGVFYISGPAEEFYRTNHLEISSPESSDQYFNVYNEMAHKSGGVDVYSGHVILDGPTEDEAFLIFENSNDYHSIWFEIINDNLFVVIEFVNHSEYNNDKIYFVAESYTPSSSQNNNASLFPKYNESFKGKYLSIDNDARNYSDLEIQDSDVDNSSYIAKVVINDKYDGKVHTRVGYVFFDGYYESTPTYMVEFDGPDDQYPIDFRMGNDGLSISILWGDEGSTYK